MLLYHSTRKKTVRKMILRTTSPDVAVLINETVRFEIDRTIMQIWHSHPWSDTDLYATTLAPLSEAQNIWSLQAETSSVICIIIPPVIGGKQLGQEDREEEIGHGAPGRTRRLVPVLPVEETLSCDP